MPPKTLLSALQELQSRYQSFQAEAALEKQEVAARQWRLQEHNDHLVAKTAILEEEIKGLRGVIEVGTLHPWH